MTASGQDKYPRHINDTIVGFTMDQVDEVNYIKIDRDQQYKTIDLYGKTIMEFASELKDVQCYAGALEVSNLFQYKQIGENIKAQSNYTSILLSKDREIKSAKKDLKRQKLKTALAWGAGALATGVMAGLYISK